jgi:hypothetical protein
MLSSRDTHIIELWLEKQASPHTRGCYRRDAAKRLSHVSKPLSRLTLGDLQSFAQSLIQAAWHPSRAPVRWPRLRGFSGSAFGCATLPPTPPRSFRCPAMRGRLAERIVSEDDKQIRQIPVVYSSHGIK